MRYVCVHGHFYQPPRENPSLEAVELQESAYPYHDWNERVTAECYAPNAASRILDAEGWITKVVSNYAQMSFNFGPTLLSWIQVNAPNVYAAIQEADVLSARRFSGHGSAIAQAYNHMIMPLANQRDVITQVKWGIQDFAHRFGRQPEGMWLPETAVNVETLRVMAENGIRFTILAPRQAARIRRRDSRSWKDVSGGRIDPSRAYTVRLPSKRSISVFFYDGPISHGVAFEGLLQDGKRFAERLVSGFADQRTWPQLVHIATDGESYGHHHKHGEMALTYALHHIETENLATLTNYGEFLEKHPPDHFVEIVENSSWSCAHGIERWRSDCGCNSGRDAWNQAWRKPLREALDWLRDELATAFERGAQQFLRDPWAARDDYIRVILDRSEESLQRFWKDHAIKELTPEDQVTALKLLEAQRHAMLMYTSCGWFFDELSGIETVQVMLYAGRALRLAESALGCKWEMEFENRLRAAQSNLPEHGDGAKIYEKWVKPAFVDADKAAGHYAVSSLFKSYSEETRIYCYNVERQDYSVEAEGKMRLAVGRIKLDSQITRESSLACFAVLHLGDHNLVAGVRPPEAGDTDHLRTKLLEPFSRADTTATLRMFDEELRGKTFDLSSLFREERREIADLIVNDSLRSAVAVYRTVYENHAPLIRFLNELKIPIPEAFKSAAQIFLNDRLRDAVEQDELDTEHIRSLLKEAEATQTPLDSTRIGFALREHLERRASEFAASAEPEHAEKLVKILRIAPHLSFPVHIWEVQNKCYAPLVKLLAEHGNRGNHNGQESRLPLAALNELKEQLRIRTG
jgi:alpha-amylase/alpha-mannosidase (GH57 family)